MTSFSQMLGARSALMVGAAGRGLILTVTGSETDDEQPLASVMDTEKVPACKTLIRRLRAPLLQLYCAELVESRTVLSPSQKVRGRSAVITGLLGRGLTVTLMEFEIASQPLLSLMRTL